MLWSPNRSQRSGRSRGRAGWLQPVCQPAAREGACRPAGAVSVKSAACSESCRKLSACTSGESAWEQVLGQQSWEERSCSLAVGAMDLERSHRAGGSRAGGCWTVPNQPFSLRYLCCSPRWGGDGAVPCANRF